LVEAAEEEKVLAETQAPTVDKWYLFGVLQLFTEDWIRHA
jgi:hypothetical protein